MRNLFLLITVVLVCAGCAELPNSVLPAAVNSQPSDRISIGMTRDMVAAVMDSRVVVGYEIDPDSGVSRQVQVDSLYSSEIVTVKGVAYQVDRYIVRPPVAGARMIEAELYPVVYKDGLLVAKGLAGLAQIRQGSGRERQ